MIPHHSFNDIAPAQVVAFSGPAADAAPAIQHAAYAVQPAPSHLPVPALQHYETLLSSLSFAMAALVLLAEMIRAMPRVRRRAVPVPVQLYSRRR